MIVGLADGLLVAIPIYLVVRALCVSWRLRRKGESLSRKQAVELPAFLLGGASLVTPEPLWFQLELPIVSAIVLARWALTGNSPFIEAELPFKVQIVGERSFRLLKILFLGGLLVIPTALLLLALYASPTPWLVVRTLAPLTGLVTLSILATWLAARHGQRDAEGTLT